MLKEVGASGQIALGKSLLGAYLMSFFTRTSASSFSR